MESELQDFIQSSFKSIWALELMLFLKRNPERAWAAEDLVRELRGSAPVVAQGAAALQFAGLVAEDDDHSIRYLPASPALGALADSLEDAYREKPTAVRRLILSAPNEKLRTLADAFRLRKE